MQVGCLAEILSLHNLLPSTKSQHSYHIIILDLLPRLSLIKSFQMGLTNREDLDIVQLVYYGIATPLIAYLLFQHGFARQIGWLYLAVLALLRIIGAATGIASVKTPSEGLIETTLICTSVGISPLLLSLLGILGRLSQGMKGQGVSQRLERLIHIPILVGLIMAIIAGTKEFSADASTRHDGYTMLKVAVLLYLVGLLALAVVAFQTFRRKQFILDGEMRLLTVSLLSLPFLLVRIIYSIISAFSQGSNTFSIISDTNRAVVIQAIMSVLMEFSVVALFIAAGVTVRRIPREMVNNGYAEPPNYNNVASTKAPQEYPMATAV